MKRTVEYPVSGGWIVREVEVEYVGPNHYRCGGYDIEKHRTTTDPKTGMSAKRWHADGMDFKTIQAAVEWLANFGLV